MKERKTIVSTECVYDHDPYWRMKGEGKAIPFFSISFSCWAEGIACLQKCRDCWKREGATNQRKPGFIDTKIYYVSLNHHHRHHHQLTWVESESTATVTAWHELKQSRFEALRYKFQIPCLETNSFLNQTVEMIIYGRKLIFGGHPKDPIINLTWQNELHRHPRHRH